MKLVKISQNFNKSQSKKTISNKIRQTETFIRADSLWKPLVERVQVTSENKRKSDTAQSPTQSFHLDNRKNTISTKHTLPGRFPASWAAGGKGGAGRRCHGESANRTALPIWSGEEKCEYAEKNDQLNSKQRHAVMFSPFSVRLSSKDAKGSLWHRAKMWWLHRLLSGYFFLLTGK